ncbi:MAG: L-serine ammonia-lyase, iron-sulfur-dependent, subunit beta [Candidatus Schekmanbacteria bacterium]|nr:L-serine ammonia-lyase, iron-sulfur-dependent, subunit beta [Candidatus Schekmanbacteria bacterium]
MALVTLFDVLGPIMVGPSSSHTAGACRLGLLARQILGGTPERARIGLHGSFAATGEGHGTQPALIGGLLGLDPADERLGTSRELAGPAGMKVVFHSEDLGQGAHPNSVRFVLQRCKERVEVTGASLGGGVVEISAVDGFAVRVRGDLPAVMVVASDVPGSIAHITGVLAEDGVNLATMHVGRRYRGADAVMVLETDTAPSAAALGAISRFSWVHRVRSIAPVSRASGAQGELPGSMASLLAACTAGGGDLAAAIAEMATAHGGSKEGLRARLEQTLEVMQASVRRGLGERTPSPSGLSGWRAATLADHAPRLVGDTLRDVLAAALAVLEVNARMGVIAAAPTAGGAGVLPAVLFVLANARGWGKEALANALLVAGGVGAVIAARATLSGAEGGCQAETGSAAAMAAAAVTYAEGGSAEQVSQAVSLALQGMIGLICDPLAGLVEIPCGYRNASAAVQAIAAAEMALAGMAFPVPADEVIDTVAEVGRRMDAAYRETARGGLATTPAGLRARRACGRCA